MPNHLKISEDLLLPSKATFSVSHEETKFNYFLSEQHPYLLYICNLAEVTNKTYHTGHHSVNHLLSGVHVDLTLYSLIMVFPCRFFCAKMMECRGRNLLIAIIAYVVLFLIFIYRCLYQSTNDNLGSLIPYEIDENVTYITKQNEDTPPSFQDGDKLIAPTENTHSVSKPAAVCATFELVPTHTSAQISLLPANTSPVRFHNHLVDFNPHGNDTMVVIHIQKTGGKTFVEHLHTLKQDGKDLCEHAEDQKWFIHGKELSRAMYRCPRNWNQPDEDPWLLTERTFHIPWICGVHSSYADFKYCLPRLKNRYVNPHRNFLYATMLRHPVIRYISEYAHVQQGATWLPDHMWWSECDRGGNAPLLSRLL